MDTSILPIAAKIDYPESDGKPMGETDVHRREIAEIIAVLERFFVADANVYVSGNLMFYYEEGEPGAVVSPDVFVVRGIPKGLRRTYKLWVEQLAPVVVFEITSRSTRLEDKGNKHALYSMLGVQEYFLFDPLAEYLNPPLQGFTLINGEYHTLLPQHDGTLNSQALGLKLTREGTILRLINSATSKRLLRSDELDQARQAAEQQRHAEQLARQAAEQQAAQLEVELEQLRAELKRLRGE